METYAFTAGIKRFCDNYVNKTSEKMLKQGLCLPSDTKMTNAQLDEIIEIIADLEMFFLNGVNLIGFKVKQKVGDVTLCDCHYNGDNRLKKAN